MNDFLTDTNEKRRDGILSDLHKNSAEIGSSVAAVDDGASRQLLMDAKELVDGLVPRVQEMWQLYQTESGAEQSLGDDLKVIAQTHADVERFPDKTSAVLSAKDCEANDYIRSNAQSMQEKRGMLNGGAPRKSL